MFNNVTIKVSDELLWQHPIIIPNEPTVNLFDFFFILVFEQWWLWSPSWSINLSINNNLKFDFHIVFTKKKKNNFKTFTSSKNVKLYEYTWICKLARRKWDGAGSISNPWASSLQSHVFTLIYVLIFSRIYLTEVETNVFEFFNVAMTTDFAHH